jgi:hypothetical protein
MTTVSAMTTISDTARPLDKITRITPNRHGVQLADGAREASS